VQVGKEMLATAVLEDVRLHLLTLSSAKEVVGHILQMNQTKQKRTISLLWVWWLSRNKANVGERMLSVNEVVSRTSVSAVEIYKDSQDHVNIRGGTLRKENRWRPPPADVLKINSDGAFHIVERSGAWGFVVRDSDGFGVLEGSGRLKAVHDALSAEGEACLAALRAATEYSRV